MTRTFELACQAIEAAIHGRPGGYRIAVDGMVRELADGGASVAEISDWEEFVKDRVAHPES
jgi:hypothetical protein